METLSVRASVPGLGGTETATVPSPLPAPEVIAIQPEPLIAIHWQSRGAVTDTKAPPPSAPKVAPDGEIE